MYLSDIEQKWGINLAAISAEGTSSKRWDFVVKTKPCIYVIETNFYTGGGWNSARRNLEETFNVLDTLYNITDMENGVFDRLFRQI